MHYGNDLALWNAAQDGHLETATLLLLRGAIAHNHILAQALRNSQHAVANLLRAHGAL